jgi:hypothetical protein
MWAMRTGLDAYRAYPVRVWWSASGAFSLWVDKTQSIRYDLDSLDGLYVMSHSWQLQHAKNKFSEVVEAALNVTNPWK